MSRTTILLAMLLLGGAPALAEACDTPVYRYAMYRWESAPYETYLFHDAELSEADAEIVTALEVVESRLAPRTNAVLIQVDLREENALERLPPDVRRRWQERQEKTLPAYLTVSPLGGLVSWETLTPDMLPAMHDSPARQTMARQLADAKAGVFVILTGTDPLANQAAEQEVRRLAEQLEQGSIPLYRAPTDPTGEPTDQSQADDAPQIGIVMVARNDPQEQWLVNALLAVEGDLREIEKPMVFPIYGRGRALPPFVGAGITANNLTDAVSFITGACSCTVKDQNPGVDLLLTYDWESAADAMKEKFGSEEGNESFAGNNLFPQLIIPGETGGDAGEADSSEQAGGEGSGERGADAGGKLVAAIEHSPAEDGGEALPEAEGLAMAASHEETSHGEAAPSAGEQRETSRLYLTLGVGFGLGLLLLGVGTFFVFRHE